MDDNNGSLRIEALRQYLDADLTPYQRKYLNLAIGVLEGANKRTLKVSSQTMARVNSILGAIDPIAALRALRDQRSPEPELNNARVAKALQLNAAGKTTVEICRELRMSEKTLLKIRTDAGVHSLTTEKEKTRALKVEPALDIVFIYFDRHSSIIGLCENNLRLLDIDCDAVFNSPGCRQLPSPKSEERMPLAEFEIRLSKLDALYAKYGAIPSPEERDKLLQQGKNAFGDSPAIIVCHEAWELAPTSAIPTNLTELGHQDLLDSINRTFRTGTLHYDPVNRLPFTVTSMLSAPEWTRLGNGFLPTLESAISDINTRLSVSRNQGAENGELVPYIITFDKATRDKVLWRRLTNAKQFRANGFLKGIPLGARKARRKPYAQIKDQANPEDIEIIRQNWKLFVYGLPFHVNRGGDGNSYTHPSIFPAEEADPTHSASTVYIPTPVDWGGRFTSRLPGPCQKSFQAVTGENGATSLEFFEANLQNILFQIIRSKAFSKKIKILKAQQAHMRFYENLNQIGDLWLKKPKETAGVIKQWYLQPKLRSLAVGIAIVTYGTDFIISAANEKQRVEMGLIAQRILEKVHHHILINRESICQRLENTFKAQERDEPELGFDTALRKFAQNGVSIIRAILLAAARAFNLRVADAAATGVALKTLEEGKRLVASGRYKLDDYWPVVVINGEEIINAFVKHLELSTRTTMGKRAKSLDGLEDSGQQLGDERLENKVGPAACKLKTDTLDEEEHNPFKVLLKRAFEYEKRLQSSQVLSAVDKCAIKDNMLKLFQEAGPEAWGELQDSGLNAKTLVSLANMLNQRISFL